MRCHLRRQRAGALDGRKDKSFVAEQFVGPIDAWIGEHACDDRPVNARDLYDHLVRACRYIHSYKSVLRYV